MSAAGFPAAFACLPHSLAAGSRFVAALSLALLYVLAAPTAAQAQTEVWSATLTVKNLGSPEHLGCNNADSSSTNRCNNSAVLSDDDFSYDGHNYAISLLRDTPSVLQVGFTTTIAAGKSQSLVFIADGIEFAFDSASAISGTNRSWNTTAVSWSAGDTVAVSLVEPLPPPTFASGSVPANGWGISLIFSEDIDRTAAGLPPASAFRVTKDGGTAFAPNAVTAPGNNEKSLRLGLGGAGRVRTGETVTVTYTDPTTGDDTAAIQNLDGLDAATFTDQSVTNNSTFLPPDAPKNLKAEAGDGKVELSWEAPDDNGGTAVTGYQHRHSAGTTVTTTATWSGTITDKAVTVSSLTNNTEYAFEVRAENSSGAGAPASATATPVAATTPVVTCVATPAGGTEVWSSNVVFKNHATASRRGHNPNGTGYPGSSSTDDNFILDVTTYTVRWLSKENANTDFILALDPHPAAADVSTLTLHVGSTSLAFTSATRDTEKFTWSGSGMSAIADGDTLCLKITEPPAPATVSSVAVTSSPDSGDTYGAGETIEFTVTFSEAVTVTGGPPTFEFKLGPMGSGVETAATFDTSTSGTAELVFEYTVQTGDSDPNGIYIGNQNTTLKLNSATITSNGVDAVLDHAAPGTQSGHKVDGSTSPTTTVPGAPTGLSATKDGATAIDLAWTAPTDNGGAAISGYYIEVSSDGGSNWVDRESDTGSDTTTYQHTGLDPGTRRHYRVSAINSAGTGDPSNTASDTTVSAPGPPTSVSATPLDGAVTVNWQNPSTTGGAAIDCFQLRQKKSTQTDYGDWDRCRSAGGVSYSTLVQNLDNGTEYNFQVQARNSAGLFSDPSSTATATPRGVPGPPQNVSASGGTGSVALGWDPPTSTGGARIRHYQYSYKTTGGYGAWTDAGSSGSSRSWVVTGLASGMLHTFKVRAVNAAGGGTDSAEVTATPTGTATEPGPPRTLNASGGDGRVSLSWSAPTSNGGAAISSYEYRYKTTGNYPASWTTVTGGGSARSVTVFNLTNDTLHTFQVRARNSVGPGTESNEATATPTATGTNAAPTFDDGDSTFRFVDENTAAGQNVGTAVGATDTDTGDTLTYTLGGTDAASFAIVRTSGQIQTRAALNHEAKDSYSLTVMVSDGNGGTDSINVTIEVDDDGVDEVPLAPRAPRVTPDAGSDTSLQVTWSAPSNPGPDITGYDVQYREGTSGTWTNGPQGVSGTRATIAGLTAARTAYQVQVRATNSDGDGPWSPPGRIGGGGGGGGRNDPPLAVDDAAETVEGTPVFIDVLGNDSDPDGDTLTVVEVSAPTHGTAVVADTGAVEYTPEPDFHGTDRFTYVVGDGSGLTAQAAVDVTVLPVNDPPLAGDDAAETVEDTPAFIDVLGNDSDPDGDTLTVVEVSAPTHGTAVVADTGAVEYTPGPDFHGTDRFTYVVGDGSGLTARAAVDVTVLPVNDPPLAGDDAAETVEDTPAFIDVLGNDRDPDGDTLTVVEVSAPTHGTAVVADTGAVEYTPGPDFHGTDRFTYVVGDGSGLTAPAAVDVTVLPVNDPPLATGVIPDQTLDVGDGPAVLDLIPFFTDRDGDALGYTAVVSDQAVAVSLTGATLTLTATRRGTATVTVTAQDPGGLTATQAFMVTTTDHQARGVVEDTLAALGRGHLASARATLGRRVETTGQEQSQVTVAGLHVPLGTGAAAAGRAVAERWMTGVAGGMPLQSGGRTWMDPAPGAEAVGALGAPAAPLGMAGGAPYGAGASPTLSNVSPLSAGGQTDFLLALGSGQAGGGTAQGQRWTVWGQSDQQAFRGERSPAARYDGHLQTAYVGVDARLSERWLAGVAVSRSRGNGDWTFGSSTGRLTTSLTSVQPYLRWSDGGTTIWATAGGGTGSAENERVRYGLQEQSDLGLRLGLVEVRRRLATVGGGVALQVRGDASWARLTTAAGHELIDALAVDVHQLRVGIDVSRPVRTAGGTLVEPFGEVHARHDGGSGQTGAGLEVAGGLRVARGVFRVEGMGRLLALHAAAGYREHGGAVTLSVGDGARQPGLTLSLSPRWGARATASDALWQDHLFHQRAAGAGRDERALDARVDYGLQLHAGGLVTPFGIYGQSQYGRRLQVGLLLSRLGPVGLEVSGERSALRHPGRDDYRMSVLGRITFGGADNAAASPDAVP